MNPLSMLPSSPNHAESSLSSTPMERKLAILLSQAIARGSVFETKLRLEQGANAALFPNRNFSWNDPRSVNDPDAKDSKNALMLACERGEVEIAQLVLPLCDPKATNGLGETALMFAADRGQAGCVKLLLPLSDPRARDHAGRDALMHLARGPFSMALLSCAELLIPVSERAFVDDEGHDALMVLISMDSFSGAAPNTAFVLALAKDADLLRRAADGQNALMKALSLKRKAAAEALLPFYEDAALRAVDEHGRSAAYLAAWRGFGELAAALNRRAPSREHPPYQSSTLLMVAASAGKAEAVKALLPDSDPLAVDANGCDALMLAIDHGAESDQACEAALALIPLCDLTRRDSAGQDAWDKARSRGRDAVVAALAAIRLAIAERDALSLNATTPIQARLPRSARAL